MSGVPSTVLPWGRSMHSPLVLTTCAARPIEIKDTDAKARRPSSNRNLDMETPTVMVADVCRWLLYRPALARRWLAAGENQGRQVRRAAVHYVEAFPADPDNLSVDDRPLLAGRAIASHQDDCCAFPGGPAVNVDAAAETLGNTSLADEPALIGAPVALKQIQRTPIGSGAVTYFRARTAVADQLCTDDRNGIGNRDIRGGGASRRCNPREAK